MTELADSMAPETRRDTAVDWFLRRSVGPLPAADEEAFDAWLARSPANREAYVAVEEFWAGTAQLETLAKFQNKRQTILQSVDRRRTTRRAVMAGLAVMVLGGAGFGVFSLSAPKPLATHSFKTAVGQQATVTLPDGSVVTLNTNTVLRTKADPDRRLVYLDKGQAYFRVAKDRRRPFIVAAAGRTVTALGTAFDLRVDGGALRVVLVEGRVRVAAVEPAAPKATAGTRPSAPQPAAAQPTFQSTDMGAGSQLVALGEADWRLSRANVDRETSWLRGKIVFDDEALGDVVAELNRYSERKIVIADAHLVNERLSGIYKPGDIQGFARALRHTGLAEVKEESGGEVRIVAMK